MSGNLPPGIRDIDIDRATWDDRAIVGECDCCGRTRELSRCFSFGTETYACDECRGES